MLYTPHFLTGAAIVKLVPNPLIGLPLAFLSHILLDLTPHNDFDIRPGVTWAEILEKEKKRKYFLLWVLGLDIILMTLSAIWLSFQPNNLWLIAGGIVGISPDLVEQGIFVLMRITLPGWQDKLQWRVSAKYGFLSYPIVSLLALAFLLES